MGRQEGGREGGRDRGRGEAVVDPEFLKGGFILFDVRRAAKNFCLTTPNFSETMPIKSPVYLVRVHSHKK